MSAMAYGQYGMAMSMTYASYRLGPGSDAQLDWVSGLHIFYF